MGVGRRATAVRWGIVAALVAVLAALPSVIGALPASDSGVSAPELRARVLASDGVGFSGYAESAGGLALPVTDPLTSVARPPPRPPRSPPCPAPAGRCAWGGGPPPTTASTS